MGIARKSVTTSYMSFVPRTDKITCGVRVDDCLPLTPPSPSASDDNDDDAGRAKTENAGFSGAESVLQKSSQKPFCAARSCISGAVWPYTKCSANGATSKIQ